YLAAVGQTKGNDVQVNLLTNTDLRTVEDFEQLVDAERDGAVVRLRDVASVELGAEEAEFVAKFNHDEAVYLGVYPLVGANEIEVAHRLYEPMERSEASMPPDTVMAMAYDSTTLMQDAIEEISKTLLETMLFVGFVVLLFMGSIRPPIVPMVAIPVLLIGATISVLAFGFS